MGIAKKRLISTKRLSGGDFTMVVRSDETPMEVAENEKNRVMYIELPIGENDKLMGSDIFESLGQKLTTGNHNYVSISVDSKAEADRLFHALSEGGEIEMPMEEQFFGYFGDFKDKFGISWMIIFEEGK